jgi:RNA polymerase sigma-70 factor (ECF subfamily)
VQRAPSLKSSFTFAIGADGGACYSPGVREETSSPLPRAVLDHLDALFRLARHLTGNDSDAEDLVQEAYTRAYGARSQFVSGTNVRAWLFRILRNAFIDGYRRERSNPIRDSTEDHEDVEQTGSHEPLRGDAELERLRGVVAADIEAALRSLSVNARTIVLLDLEGLTEREIGEVLGFGVGTVKSRLFRARAALRERLRDYAR